MLNLRGIAVATLLLSFVTRPVSAREPGLKLSKVATGRHCLSHEDAADDGRAKSVDSIVQDAAKTLMENGRTSGLSIGIYKDGKTYTYNFGTTERGGRWPPTAQGPERFGYPWQRRSAMRPFPALAITSMVGIVAPADEGSSYQYVDLGPKGNQALAQDIGGKGNHLKEVPQGEHDFKGTKFKVGEKMVHVRAESKPELPEKVEGIKVDARFDKLHLLQSTEFGEGPGDVEDGTAIGAYVVHYADKTEETIPIVYGEGVRDWWDWKDRNELKRAKVAWRGKNNYSAENGREIRLFSEAWTNPHPDKMVTTIDVVSKKTACAPFLVALTLETRRK